MLRECGEKETLVHIGVIPNWCSHLENSRDSLQNTKSTAILSNGILCGEITTGDWYLDGVDDSDGSMDVY